MSQQGLGDLASEKEIVLFGATTSARDLMEEEFAQTGQRIKYICDFSEGKWGKSFDNRFHEVLIQSPEVLLKEDKNQVFVIIATLFDDEVAAFLEENGFQHFVSAREFLNERVDVAQYWDERYKNGYGTGDQSQGILLEKQIAFTNQVIADNGLKSAFELGCGDGRMLAHLKLEEYVGVDISSAAIKLCKEKYAGDDTKKFYVSGEYQVSRSFDLSLSLGNVISSLPDEDAYVNYMEDLFSASNRYICIFSPDRESAQFGHIKARNFSAYVEEHLKDWQLEEIKETGYQYKPGDPLDAKFYVYKKVK